MYVCTMRKHHSDVIHLRTQLTHVMASESRDWITTNIVFVVLAAENNTSYIDQILYIDHIVHIIHVHHDIISFVESRLLSHGLVVVVVVFSDIVCGGSGPASPRALNDADNDDVDIPKGIHGQL